MPSRPHVTLDEKAVIIAKRAMKKSFRGIAKEVNRSPTTVFDTIKNTVTDANISTIRERVLIALNERGLTDTAYADKCISLLNCQKHQLNGDGKIELVPDNQTQAKVLNTVKDIMGLDAPRQEERKITIELSPAEQDEILIIRRKHSIIK